MDLFLHPECRFHTLLIAGVTASPSETEMRRRARRVSIPF